MWRPGDPHPTCLGDLPGRWLLRVRCGGCGRRQSFAVAELTARHGITVTAEAVVRNLRCSPCGGRVVEADLAARAEAGAPGFPDSDKIATKPVAIWPRGDD